MAHGVRSAQAYYPVQSTIVALQQDLLNRAIQLSGTIPDFRSRYLPVLRSYDQPFLVQDLKTDASFVTRGRQLIFNASAFNKFHSPINAMERDGLIPVDEASIARHIATEQIVLHELPHVTQGIGEYEDIAPIKKLVNPDVIAEFDIVADSCAARVGARLEMLRADERGWQCYAHRLLHQLYVQGEFAAKGFGSPATKQHKRKRFLGIAMMTAVARDALWSGRPPRRTKGEFPIGTPLLPYFDTLDGSMIIFAFDQDRKMWKRPGKVDVKLLSITCAGLDQVSFAVTVDRAARLLQQVGALSVRSDLIGLRG